MAALVGPWLGRAVAKQAGPPAGKPVPPPVPLPVPPPVRPDVMGPPVTFVYDSAAKGCRLVTASEAVTTCTYDGKGKLLSVSGPPVPTNYSYGYDAHGGKFTRIDSA